MCVVTERARTFEFYLFGGDLDFPERYELYIANKLLPYLDRLETDDEDIENALWKQGNVVLTAADRFALFNQRTGDLLIFSIGYNFRSEGFFISLLSCFSTDAESVKKKSCPVITVN